jgi:hypothetical protein
MSKRAAYTFLFIVPALAFALLATERAAFAQPDEELGDETTGEVGIGPSFFNQFGGDEENFLVLSFRPVIKLGNLWMGLNFTVPLDSSGEVREDAFNEETDYLAMIRFLQWGKERDFLYFRFGELSQATIGHGSIVHNYFNGLDYNSPKTGGRLNLNWGLGLRELGEGLHGGRSYSVAVSGNLGESPRAGGPARGSELARPRGDQSRPSSERTAEYGL